MAKKKLKFVSPDEYYTKKNFVTPDEYYQNKKKREAEQERQRKQQEEARKKQQREASLQRTKEWQQEYNDAKYAGGEDKSWQVYAAKLISETPGALEKEQQRANKAQAQANQYWRDLSREATNAGTPEIAYAAKQIHDSPVSRADITKYGSESAARQAKLNEFLEGLNKQKRTEQYGKRAEDAYQIGTGTMDVSKVWGQTPKALSDAMQVQNAKESAAAIRKMRSAGEFDDQGDISLWSPDRRQSAKAAMQAQATVYQKQIDELNRKIGEQENTGNRWDPLLDLYTSEEVEKLRDILYDRDFSEEERNRGEGHTRAEKQKAQEQLDWILNRTKGIGSQSVSDSAKNFYKYNQKNLNEYRDHMNMDSMRRMAYDAVNGNGAYDQIMSGLKGNEQKELNDRIDTALDYVTDENGRLGVQLRTAQSQLDYINGQIKDIDYYDKQDRKVDELLEGYRLGDTQFHDEYVTDAAKQAALPSYSRTRPHGETGGIVNPVDAVYATLGGYGYSDEQNITGVEYHNALLMEGIYAPGSSRNAKDIFISLYNEGKKDQAWAFYQGLQPTLNQMYHYYDQLSMEDTTMKLPIISSTVSVALSPVQSLEYLYNLPGRVESYITGKQTSAADPYSGSYSATRAKNTIRNKITQELGDWGWAYQGAMSGADSAFNAALGKGIIKTLGSTVNLSKEAAEGIMKYGTLGLFATQAFETSLQNNMATGSDNFAYDVIEAYIDSAIETATEIWSVENWLSDPKNILTFVGKIAISEPSEEIVGAIVEPYIKEMLGHKNQYTERANEILANGGYQDGDQWVKVTDIDTATRQAMREWNHDIRMAAQEALLSVGPSMVFGSAQNAMQTRGIGSVLNMYEDSDAVKQMAEKAVAMGEGTDSYKSGKGILDRLVKGKKAGNYQVGQLAQNVLREGGETISETTAQTRKEQIAGFLQENGVSEEDAAGLAETVEKAIEKGGIEKLSKKERQAIHANQAATNALYRFGMTEGKHTDVKTQEALTEEVKNRTQKETEAVKSISDLFNKNTERKLMLREATPDEISEVKGERINNNREVIVYDRKTGEGRFAQIEGIEVKKRNGNWNLRLRVAGQDRTLSASDVKLTNYQTAQVINQATNIPELYSEGYTNLMLDAANEGQFTNENIVDMMRDAKKLRLYAYAGFLSDQVPQTNLPQQLAERIWTQSMTEHYRNRKNQPGEYNRQRTGRAVFGDAVFGTQAWTDAVKDLDEDTVDWMETIAGVAQRAGIDVTFKSMEDNGKTWGWEGKEGIGLNISGRNYVRDLETKKVVETGKHNMMITFGHELTHWLGRNSLQGYNRLEKFVLQNYINDNGYEKFEERINHRMYNMGESLEEAIAEIVADSCDQILLDEQVQQKIAQTDSKLFSEIKGFVKNLVERFKKAIKGDPQTSASQYSKAMAAHINEIRKLWLGAYDEALSGYITDENGKQLTPEEYQQMVAEETAEKGKSERYSRAQLDKDYMEAVESGDMEAAQRMVDEAADKAGYSIEAYHGTAAPFTTFDRSKLGEATGAASASVGFYLTDSKQVAESFSRISRDPMKKMLGVADKTATTMKLRAKIQNPYVYETDNGDSFDLFRNDLFEQAKEYTKNWAFPTTTIQQYKDMPPARQNEVGRSFAQKMRRQGYDGIIIRQTIMDGKIPHDFFIAFDSEQIKSADPIVYDDNGDVIPLSERFNDEKTDIRWSRAQLDNEYMEAVESGDVKQQIKMVQDAAEKAGYTEIWAHGSPNATFTVFNLNNAKKVRAIFLSDNGTASNYAGTSYRQLKTRNIGRKVTTLEDALEEIRRINDSWHQPKEVKGGYKLPFMSGFKLEPVYTEQDVIDYANKLRETNQGGVYNLFVKPGNRLIVDANNAWWNRINSKYGRTTDEIGQWALEHGYDSVEIDNVHDGGSNDAIPSHILLVFNENNVKTAEPVTYDDNGNVIPLSERFNDEKTDIRWSQADIDSDYMDTVESGDTARQQELVYEAGRKAGWAIKAYHGTQRGDRVGNEFRPDRATSGPMAFFTDNRGIAENYARDKRDTSIDYDPDYHEEGWEDYDWQFKVKDKNGKYVPVRTLWDNMNYSQKQKFIENAKHITTDDEGEIVYDEDTNDGLGNYDEYTLRDYKGNGIDALVYSWLKAGELLGDEETFIKVLELAGIKDAKWFNPNESHEKVYDVLLNIQNPFDTSTMYTMDFLEELSDWYYGKQGHSVYEKPEGVTNMWDKKGTTVWNWIQYGWDDMRTGSTGNWTRIPDGVTDFLKYKGYDGIKDTGGKGGGETHTVWIPFSSEQVKSADPVTYDNDGNVIPLSERFDASKTDIRWSQADVEETRDLIAYHNLGPDQLMAVLRLGGFAMPSIAITRDNYVNDRYGDITVLFRKETIDPKQSRNNKVYGGDAWTPVYPTIEYKINDNKVASILKKMKEVLPKELSRNNVDLYSDNIESNVNRNNGNIVEAVKDNTNLMAMFLIENGQEIDYPVVEKRLDGFKEFTNDQVVKVAEAIGEDVIREAEEKVGTYNYVQEHPEIVEQVRKALNDNFNETYLNKETDKKMLSMFKDGLYKEGELSSSAISKIFHAAHTYFIRGIEQEIDKYALKDRLREQIDEKDYKAWLKNLFTGVIEKSGIRNNKDKFTYSGSARSWESLHDEETLENVVRIMKAEADKGANTFFNQSAILALGTRDFKSISDIKAHKEQLQHISDEELSAAKTDIVNRFGNIMDDLADTKRESNLFIARDRVLEAIVDAVRVSRTVDGIKRIMSQWQYNISDEQAQEIADLMVEISNLPTEYFEAKPKRAVGLDEIAKVLVPEGVDQELLDALDDQGIAWEFYDGTSEDRLAKMNANDDVKFSKWTESGMDVNYWMEHATPSMVQTEDERELISLYKGKRTSISLSLRRQSEYRSRIRQLEGIVNPSTDVKSEITALKNKLEIEKKKVYRLEEEILQITRNDGWAGMMYQHNMVFRDYVEGKTQEQVRQTVDDMLKLVEQTQEQIAKDTESLKKLATHQAVQTMKSFMGKTSLGRMASILRKTYNSTMNKAEIEDRLAEMALKKASGQDITADTETLAQDLLDKMRGVRTDALESLRGQTFVIGQSLAEELKKENSSIKELQNRIKGSGVKLTTGVKSSTGEIDKHSRISEQWAELREKNGALPDVENMAEIDKLHTIIDFIEGELRASTGAEQFNADFDEVAAMVRASVGNITTYLVDDPKARAQINNLMKQIADLSKATEKTAADMQGLYGQLDEVMKAGERAKSITTVMERDVNEAIEYYNTTARVAAEKERTKVRKALIAQLRSETTEKLLKQQEHYRSMIENQKKARELHQDNEALRRKISTVASRMANRLFAETDQKNVPEETKGLVREVLRMLAENDSVFRRVTNWDKDRIDDAMKRLTRLSNQHGEFVPAKDLDFLVIKAPNEADNDYTLRDKVWQDILDIESGLEAYRKAETATLVNQQAKNDALTKIQEALSEIYSVVRARSEAFIQGKRYEVATLAEQMENEMAGSKYKGERTGKIGRAFNTMEKMVGYGNLTPEYFFKNLKNGVMKILHGGFHDAEQRAGLEALRAKLVVQQIAKDTHYDTWDPQEKHQVKLPGGREITMTTEQIMALYATWKRESSQLRPEETAHLLKGGFVLAQGDLSEGIYGRQRNDQRPIRMNEETLEGLRNYLTEDQIRYVVELVNYMSGELAEIGNETSMQQYGIKKFTERYYYPIKAWGGVLNKSSASGIVNKSDARAMRQSFTKNLTANAQNAIEIGDFTPTVMNHIVGMITFNTVGPAVENMNKVLNQQLTYGEAVYDENGEIAEDNRYKRNVRAIFQDAYGVNALKYLERFMDDVNGGMTRQQDKSIQEKLLSVFRKGAVAGSLSVAAQQPLSYIRAAMEINPVYLARALSPTHWGKIHDEMLKYSGIAVIKDMGRFDMNQGQSMIDYITPEEKISKARKAGRTAAEMTTILPEKMDALTWGRMWIACKMEQAALNKGMDTKSDEFMEKVAQRFNEVMRKTQVYDSLMVKSQNMRSTNYAIKAMTSFMAEPTLSLNVLADAVRNFNSKGGKLNMGKAAATFIMSAALQALVKAIMSSGRSPDKKKKFEEQFLTKWHTMFISEVDPLTLIPGYSDIIELFKNGELADDAWGALGKIKTIAQTGINWMTGKNVNHYRNFEDTVGQIAQLMTNVPLKNLMRDARAMYNFLNPETYAQRGYSTAMTRYGIKDSFYTADNMIGMVNSYLQMAGAGYGTTTNDYYGRIYDAEKAGNKQDAADMREYVLLKSTAEDPEKSLNTGLRKLAKEDDDLTAEQKYKKQKEYGLVKGGSFIRDEYAAGNLSRKEAERLYKKENPNASDKDILETFDKIDYEKKTGKELDSYSNYTPLYDAISNNKSDEIKAAVKHMTDNGYKAEDIKKQLTTKYKQAYLDAKGSEKTKLMDALTKAYKAIGLTAEEALKIINGWKPKKETKKK